MHCSLPRHDDAISAQRDLRDDIGAIIVLRTHFGNLLVERQFLGNRLERGEGDRQAGFAAERTHPFKFVPLAFQVRGHFEHAIADPAHTAPDFDQFLCGRSGTRHQFAIDRLVQDGARCRKTQRPGAHAFLDDAGHFGDVLGSGYGARLFPIAKHICTHRAVRHMRANIDGARQPLQLVQIFREGFPVPAHPLRQGGARNILDAFHQADQPFVPVRLGRRKADAAIAHDDSGHAMPA